jgi:23S rRNA pseudouridine2605 synthase
MANGFVVTFVPQCAKGPIMAQPPKRPSGPSRFGKAVPVRSPRRGADFRWPKKVPKPREDQPAGKGALERADGEERIAKLLARAGVASRREIERMIVEGRITLNGEKVETPATLLKSLHGIAVDGKLVKQAEPTKLFLFHKTAGYLTAERDFSGRPTIYDILPKDIGRVMPIGRLDFSTEGLLLLTNDGEFKGQMELPKTGIERSYRARAFGTVSQEQLEELIHGVEIDGTRYGRIDANLERRTGRNQWVEMTITEGKNREVRRVLEHLGLDVNRLIRTRYGPFVLGDLAPNAVGDIRQIDLVNFRNSLPK